MQHITQHPIKTGSLIEQYHRPRAGALVFFSGDVRNHHQGESVDYLEYEAQSEMAEESIAGILRDAMEHWQLHEAFAIHRVGRVNPGESSVVVITSASHREEAYAANRYIIDRIKDETPVWKKEFFTNRPPVWH